jgi:2'-5' RNA ligase
VAVDVEDPLVVSRISLVKEALLSTGVPMKSVEDYNLHITIRFIGEVSEAMAYTIMERALSGLEFERFEVEFRGLGAFPTEFRPRVVWVGVSRGLEELSRIRDSIERRLRSVGLPPERGEFRPHLTIARVKGSRNIQSLARLIEEYRDQEFGRITVESVRLKKSTLTRQGPIYETLLEVKGK